MAFYQTSCRISLMSFRRRITGTHRQQFPVICSLPSCYYSEFNHKKQIIRPVSFSKLHQGSPAARGLTYLTRSISTSSTLSSPLIKFASKDEPGQEKLIYSGPLSKMVCLVKFFSLSTSIISSGLLAALYMSNDGGVMTYVAGSLSSVMILTPLVLHWFTKGYITRLYYDFPSKTYTAFTYDFFLTDTKTEFKQSDVSLPTVSNVVSSFAIRGKPVLVDPNGFLNPNHYSHLMGYTDTEGNVTVEEAKRAFQAHSDESNT